jgi:hypothetical protein
MGESLPELHSTIISSCVTAARGAARGFRASQALLDVAGKEGGGVRIDRAGQRREVMQARVRRRECRASAQGEFDDAAKDENQQEGGDCHVQRIAHSSPGHQRLQCSYPNHLTEDEQWPKKRQCGKANATC